MAILGVFTNIGVAKAQQAQNNEGFKIFPTNFSVSDTPGALDPARTTPNAEWFVGAISSRVVVDNNTIKFICTIPPGATGVNRTIREIYIKGTDSFAQDFLFTISQPSSPILYDPSGSVTLELQLALTNADLSSIIVFNYTQATELAEHNIDPNAHPEIQAALNKAGLFTPAGSQAFKYRGQAFDEKAEWDGTKATRAYGGLTWTATHTGPDGASITLVFDGIKTSDQVRAVWNNAHPYNTVEHSGTGNEIIAAGTTTLLGGTLAVAHGDAIYRDTDNIYKQALADGTIKSKVIGFADLDGPSKRIARSSGFINRDTTTFSPGDDIFLSQTIPGAITKVQSPVKMGFVVGTNLVLIGTGGGSGGASADFDAIVTDAAGFNKYPTTQQAINAVASGGKILVAKLEQVQSLIDAGSKRISLTFQGPETGWTRYPGTEETQKINFTAIPTSGTWRIEWNAQSTVDLAYNANAAAVQAAMNALTGSGIPVTVTGDYSTGFTITWSALAAEPLITFLDAGQDAIQTVSFDTIPDDGTIQFSYNGNPSPHLAWNDAASLFETYLQSVTGITDVTVTGSFASKIFNVEWVGVDGLSPRLPLVVINNTLETATVPVTPTMNVVQLGRYPASNLKAGSTAVIITVQRLLAGSPIGPSTAFKVGGDYTRLAGMGTVQNFSIGINLNSHVGVDVEMLFVTTTTPILEGALTPGTDYHTEKAMGIPQQRVRNVGPMGDHADLWTAVAAANSGDKIVVMADQSLTANQIIDKNIEIVFTHGSKINVPGYLSGSLLTLGSYVKTKYMRMLVSSAGTYADAYLLDGIRAYHEDLSLEVSGLSTIVTNAFRIGINASAVYCHGVLVRGNAIITNGLVNSSTFANHDVRIRDYTAGAIYDPNDISPPVAEIPTGVIDGVNDSFQLSQTPYSQSAMFVFVDGVYRPPSQWNLTGDIITFGVGYLPQLGQSLEVISVSKGQFTTPPTHLEVLNNLSSVLVNTRRINFGTGLSVTQIGADEVTINAASLSGITGDVLPDTDGAYTVGSATLAWKSVFLKDAISGFHYRLEVSNGVLQAVLVP